MELSDSDFTRELFSPKILISHSFCLEASGDHDATFSLIHYPNDKSYFILLFHSSTICL